MEAGAVDGRILWQRDLSVLATIAAADGLVFASTVASGELLAVDALTGKLLWKRTGVEQYPSAPTVAGDAVYVGYLDSVQAFSARTGHQRWSYPTAGVIRKLAVSSGTLYAAVDAAGPGSVLYALRVPGSA